MVLYCAIITFLDDKQLQYKQPPKSTELTSYFLKTLKHNGYVWSEGVIRIESRNIKKYLRDIYVQVLHSIQNSLTIVSSLCTLASSKKKLTSLSSAHSKQRHSLGNKQSVLTHNCSSIQDYRIEMNRIL